MIISRDAEKFMKNSAPISDKSSSENGNRRKLPQHNRGQK